MGSRSIRHRAIRLLSATALLAAFAAAGSLQDKGSHLAGRTALAQDFAADDSWCALHPRACGLFAESMGTASEIADAFHRSGALADVGAALAIAGLAEEAERAVGDALEAADQIADRQDRSTALRTIAEVQAAMGFFERARTNFSHALTVAHEVDDARRRLETMCGVAVSQARVDLIADARRTFAEAFDAMDSTQYRWFAIDMISSAQSDAGLFDDALATLATQYQCCFEAYFDETLLVFRRQAAAGLSEDAHRTVAEVMSNLERIDGEDGHLVLIIEVAIAQGRAGFTDEARRTINEIKDDVNDISDDISRWVTLNALVIAQATAGSFADALETVNQTDLVLQPSIALAAIASGQAASEMFADAIATARQISSPEFRVEALYDIAVAQAAAGFTTDAQRLFVEALDDARSSDTASSAMSRVTSFIARAQADAGLFADALQTLHEFDRSDRTRRRIAVAQAEAGLFADALNTADGISEGAERTRALVGIAAAQAAQGLFADAIGSADAVAEPDARWSAMRNVAAAQAAAAVSGFRPE